ncbi:hypothetical protein D5S17_21810 [Pseudonocardiaceae bacterium YIM PH 21723]|nr:hypothetical protein D5S17_21810 [Pseudonocardiaceae bacterium YIM PH 21723]
MPRVLGGLLVGALTAALLTVGGTNAASDEQRTVAQAPRAASAEQTSTPIVLPPPVALPRPDLAAAAQQAAPDAELGILVYDRVSGQQLVSLNPDRQFATQSVVKLLIALDWLDRNGTGDAGQVQEMLSRSDDDVADQLWDDGGGTGIVSRMATRIGMTHTAPPDNPDWWGNTTTTAADLVQLYQYLLNQAPADERTVILNALGAATKTAADGFDQFFGIPDSAGSRTWAVKQGWACCTPGIDLHTTGVLGTNDRYILIVLTSQQGDVDWATASANVTAVTAALMPALVGN